MYWFGIETKLCQKILLIRTVFDLIRGNVAQRFLEIWINE